MDGLAYHTITDYRPASLVVARQRTLKAPIGCCGAGLHSGKAVTVRLLSADAHAGITFIRTDLGIAIPARFDNVVDTRLCTVLGRGDARVGTVEHLMAALVAAGLDNVTVEVDGPEIPVLDGSAEPWLFLLDCAGTVEQHAPRRTVDILHPVRVTDGDAFAELRPTKGPAGLAMALSIRFEASAIGHQAYTLEADPAAIRRDLVRARTFALRHEIDGLQKAGLARGGSLDNAIVVDGAEVLNPAGLRMADEFVRHKLLDAVGDLALAGAALHGRFAGHKSGHALNNRLLHALFADAANWRASAPADARLAA